MYNIRPTTKFQKDLKRVKKRGFDISLLTDIIKKLAAGEPLPEKNRDHQLSGDYAGCRIIPAKTSPEEPPPHACLPYQKKSFHSGCPEDLLESYLQFLQTGGQQVQIVRGEDTNGRCSCRS